MTSPNPGNSPSTYPPPIPPSGAPGQYPPPYFPPPMFFPQPPRERGGFARAIFTTLAVSILGFSITLNIYLLIANGLFSGDSSTSIQKQTMAAGSPQSVIAVVPIEGILSGQTADDLEKVLKELEGDKDIKAVVLEVDSPGGEVTASNEMYARLLRFKKERNIPLVISMQSYAASGGYYIACAGDHIVAQQTTITGSIGVFWGGLNVSKLLEKYGVDDNTIVSTGSHLKLAGSPYKEPTAEETAYRQKLIDSQFMLFKSVVMAGRKLDQATVDRLATGQGFLGDEAKQLKLIDDIGMLDDAIAIASKNAGVSGPQVVRYKRQPGFWEALGGGGQSKANMIQTEMGGVKVNIDKQAMEQFFSPRPMFLFR